MSAEKANLSASKTNQHSKQQLDADAKLPQNSRDQVNMARQAANGDAESRKVINTQIHPIITYQTNRFCRRFCYGKRYRYVCTLPSQSALKAPVGAQLCEYGNASYAWMLEDLTHPKRLLRFEGRNGARLTDYLYRIANSLPFYERWKDWRLGPRAHIPTYVQALGPAAGKAFLWLRARWTISEIAHALKIREAQAEAICQNIVSVLTERQRLYLLDPPRTVSLDQPDNKNDDTNRNRGHEKDIQYHDEAPEHRETKQELRRAWRQLSPVEQFVMEAMLVDEQDAGDVLTALRKLGISIKKGVAAADTNRQQLYYFRRKTLSKLTELMKAL